MSTSAQLPKPLSIRPSASLIIAAPIPNSGGKENGSNYRILMMKRNATSNFVNAHVYPGGIIDKADHYSNWNDTIIAGAKEQDLLTNKICAIRETFEESGLLLSNPPVDNIKDLDINLWRQKVHEDANQFKVMCKKYNINPAVEKLIPFSNWITPATEKKRYDTLFFLTILNQFETKKEQDEYFNFVSADGKETVLFNWYKPEEALHNQKERKIVMMPPQWYSLTALSYFSDYKDLAEKAGVRAFRTTDNEIITIVPQARPTNPESEEYKQGFKTFLAYPGDEKYESTEYLTKTGNRHRLYFKGRMEEFKMEKNFDVSSIIRQNSSL